MSDRLGPAWAKPRVSEVTNHLFGRDTLRYLRNGGGGRFSGPHGTVSYDYDACAGLDALYMTRAQNWAMPGWTIDQL